MRRNLWFWPILLLTGLLVVGAIAATNDGVDYIQKAAQFTGLLEKGEYEAATGLFDATLKKAMPTAKMKQTWETLLVQCGTFKRQAGSRTEKYQQYMIVFVTCEFSKAVIDIKVVMNEAGEIAGLFFLPGKLPETEEIDYNTRAETFVSLLVKEDYEKAAAQFDAKVKEALPVAKLKATWQALLAQCGAFGQKVGTKQTPSQQYMGVIVTCEFAKAVIDIKITYNTAGEIAGLFFAPGQAPSSGESVKLPEGLTEKEVAVKCDDWTLPGTLTFPGGKGPFTAVVLVHGSGPNDRDETIGPNKPFRDLAWGLASKGVAVLRYDKRTKVYGSKAFKGEATVQEETVDDALAAVALLRGMKEIFPERIFVLGHSLGGTMISRIGAQDLEIKGLIAMAGAARPLEDIILEQFTYLFNLDEKMDTQEKEQLEQIKEQVQKVKEKDLSAKIPASELPLGLPVSYWLDLRGYKPTETAAKLSQPILILQGGRDYQVTIEDFKLWQQTLKAKKNATFKLYLDLNHLFLAGTGKSTPQEYENPGHVAETVIQDIAEWVKSVR